MMTEQEIAELSKAKAACAAWQDWAQKTMDYVLSLEGCPFCGGRSLPHGGNCPWPEFLRLYESDNPGQAILDELEGFRAWRKMKIEQGKVENE